ncbi:MAG: C39 family peptidase, partial [Verrucomicrobiota bacterium]|nr:C39 family peptidase [Verrucomicrobiota bacterium]
TESPLNGTEIGNQLLDPKLWAGERNLPGNWRKEAPIATVAGSYLAARPTVFGVPAVMVQARHRSGKLDSLAITFADAGSYFGYLDEKLPSGLSRRQQEAELRRRLAGKQQEFSAFFRETETSLKEALRDLTDKRPRENRIGRTRTLRAEAIDYRKDDLVLRLLVGGQRLIRLLIQPARSATREWLDADRTALSGSALGRVYQDRVTRIDNGDVRIDNLPVVPQGYKPYCGLNTLTMAARYFGLHLDEDWLAVAGKFQNTGSAAGSQIPRLYLAVAKEAGLDLHKSNAFSLDEARGSLDRGLPVVVWRRFSAERNKVHTRQTIQASRDPNFRTATPDTATRDSWPDDKAPLHASVIVGYNATRQEVLFVESWAGLDIPRRMRTEEMSATAYLTFYFKR